MEALFIPLLLSFVFAFCQRAKQDCKAQEVPFTQLKMYQEMDVCGKYQEVKRVQGGLLVTDASGLFDGRKTTFVPMKFEDEQ